MNSVTKFITSLCFGNRCEFGTIQTQYNKRMHFLFPLVGSISQGTSFVIDKTILSMRRVSFRTHIGIGFPIFWLMMLGAFFIFRPPLFPSTDIYYLGLMAIGIVLSLVTNIFYYRALDADELSDLEIVDLFRSIPIIVVSSILFADERNPILFAAGLAASLAIIWSHWQRGHFSMQKRTVPFLLWGIMAAPVSAAIAKVLLAVWHPVALFLIQDSVVTFCALYLYGREFKKITPKLLGLLVLSSALSVGGWILFGLSYQQLGVVHTTLLFSIQPLIVYFASLIILKERHHPKKTVAFLVVLAAILVAEFYR